MLIHMIEICAGRKCIEVGRDIFEEALKIRKKMIERGDLTTRWWRRFMASLLAPTSAKGTSLFSYTDTGGTSRSQRVKSDLGNTILLLNTYACNNRLWISVGSDSTPPSINDVSLKSKIAEGLASLSSDDVSGVIVLSAGFQFTTDTTIFEVGLEWEVTLDSYNICGRFLVDRSVISGGFVAPADTPVTVSYRILV